MGLKNNPSKHNLHTVKEHLEQQLIPLVPQGAGGMVGLFKPGEEAQFITLGVTKVEDGELVNKDTLSLVGSTSKMFVGLLSMRLVQLGILSLDTELSEVMNQEYFEIFEDVALAQHITLRHMLSHTSGLQYDTDCDRNERAEQNLKTILKNMGLEAKNNPSQKIRFTNHPKDRIFSYSNQIWLATLFIEQSYNHYLQSLDGLKHELSYADILNKELLKPLDMARTGFQKSESDPFSQDPNQLQAYIEQQGSNPINSYRYKTFDPLMRAAGGLWTTPSDLMKLAAAFTQDGLKTKTGTILISKPYMKQLLKQQGINGHVGLGVYFENNRMGKGGSISSYGSTFELDVTNGNAVVSLLNFRPVVPEQFDRLALLALDDMGSTPRPVQQLDEGIKNTLRRIKSEYELLNLEQYDEVFVSKFGYIGIIKVADGLIMNWNGYTLAAGKTQPNHFIIFDDKQREGTEVLFGEGPDSHQSYLFFENNNDNSQAFKVTTKSEAIPKDTAEAFTLIKHIHGTEGKTYIGTRPDGAGAITIKVDDRLGKVIAKMAENEVPVLITKVLKDNKGEINEIWFMGNHFDVPDKLTKLIKKEEYWIMAIAISDNPEKNVEYLMAN